LVGGEYRPALPNLTHESLSLAARRAALAEPLQTTPAFPAKAQPGEEPVKSRD
jgi:hypothetical protein